MSKREREKERGSGGEAVSAEKQEGAYYIDYIHCVLKQATGDLTR